MSTPITITSVTSSGDSRTVAYDATQAFDNVFIQFSTDGTNFSGSGAPFAITVGNGQTLNRFSPSVTHARFFNLNGSTVISNVFVLPAPTLPVTITGVTSAGDVRTITFDSTEAFGNVFSQFSTDGGANYSNSGAPFAISLANGQTIVRTIANATHVKFFNLNGSYIISNAFAIGGSTPAPTTVPCFPKGSKILTADGYKNVEDVATGDRVITSENRIVRVKATSYTVECADETNAPFRIPAGTFSKNYPQEDICLSPWHAIQVEAGAWQKPKIASVLYSGVKQYGLGKPVEYFHFETSNYLRDNLVVNGAIVESHSGKQIAKSINPYTYNRARNVFTRMESYPVVKSLAK